MRLRLVDNHWTILVRAWSIRFAIFAVFFHAIGPLLDRFGPWWARGYSPITDALGYACDGGVVIARIIVQDGLRNGRHGFCRRLWTYLFGPANSP